jgi:hypothetical protein
MVKHLAPPHGRIVSGRMLTDLRGKDGDRALSDDRDAQSAQLPQGINAWGGVAVKQ